MGKKSRTHTRINPAVAHTDTDASTDANTEARPILATNTDVGKLFVIYCKSGNLEGAQFLFRSQKVDIKIFGKDAFLGACSQGHIPCAKYVHAIGGTTPEIENQAFLVACNFALFTVVQWLHSLKRININAKIPGSNLNILKVACVVGHAEIVKWLYSLDGIDTSDPEGYCLECCACRSTINERNNFVCGPEMNLYLTDFLLKHGANIHAKDGKILKLFFSFDCSLEMQKVLIPYCNESDYGLFSCEAIETVKKLKN